MNNCITVQELKTSLKGNLKVVIIDVRSSEEYEAKHIPDALNIPLDTLDEAASAFSKDSLIVTACGKGGGRSAAGAVKLQKLGFNATYLCGGTFGWFEENK